MSGKDILPGKDAEFDILQQGLLHAITENATTWNIPSTEIMPLTSLQTAWAAAWQIARNKQNCSTAQRERKNEARKAYKKVLRPFIQRWIFRNANMDEAAILKCGLQPRQQRGAGSHKPLVPLQIKAERGEVGEIRVQCAIVPGTENYGCIAVQGRPLPTTIKLNQAGQWLITQDSLPIPAGQLLFVIDENKKRKKRFTGLRPGVDYFFYFYTVNFRGVSALSEAVMLKCW